MFYFERLPCSWTRDAWRRRLMHSSMRYRSTRIATGGAIGRRSRWLAIGWTLLNEALGARSGWTQKMGQLRQSSESYSQIWGELRSRFLTWRKAYRALALRNGQRSRNCCSDAGKNLRRRSRLRRKTEQTDRKPDQLWPVSSCRADLSSVGAPGVGCADVSLGDVHNLNYVRNRHRLLVTAECSSTPETILGPNQIRY